MFDNYYGSLEVCQELDKIGVQFICTSQKNRPSFLFNFLQKNLKKGEWKFLTKNNIMAISFFDSGKVNFFTNCSDTFPIDTRTRTKSRVCMDYNTSMGFVDKFNSHLNGYLNNHRKFKWTKCLLCTLFQMTLVNSWILYKKTCKKFKI